MMSSHRGCGCHHGDSDGSAPELFLSPPYSQRMSCSARSSSSGSGRSSRAELREENLWLVQQLAIADAQTRHLQENVRQLRRSIKTMNVQHASEKAQWQKEVEMRQCKWTDEYDRHMQSLLQIIAHHEANQVEMQREIEELRQVQDDVLRIGLVKEQATQTDDKEQHAADECSRDCQCTIASPSDDVVNDPASDFVCTEQHGGEERPNEEEPPPIHEQYVALTMQKLLERLRVSNNSTAPGAVPIIVPSLASIDPMGSSLPVSFRDSIHMRLNSTKLSRPQLTTVNSTVSPRDVSPLRLALSPVHEENSHPSRRSQPAA